MTGQAHWLVIVPLLLVGAVIGWVWFRERTARLRYVHEVRRFKCPVLGRKVTAELVRVKATNEVVGVAHCDAFPNGEAVSCPKECVALFHRPARQTVAGTV